MSIENQLIALGYEVVPSNDHRIKEVDQLLNA